MMLNDVIDVANKISEEAASSTTLRWSDAWLVRDALLKHMGEEEFASWDCRLLAPTTSRAPARAFGEGEA